MTSIRLAVFAFVMMVSVMCTACAGNDSESGSSQSAASTPVIREQANAQRPQIATDPSFREVKGEIIPGAPDFPAYPGATLVGSAERNKPNEPNEGYVLKWTTADSVPMVMAWFQKMLPQFGWTYTPPSDGVVVEQTARIAKGNVKGILDAEVENGLTEISVVFEPQR